ncbi:hypothetical protein ACF0H5_010104 [Mactra antiquata]
MDAKLYKKLEVCDAEKSWRHVRDVVAKQLMGDVVFPVPFLREASNYDIGHVILKSHRSPVQKLTGIQSVALPVGQLSEFVTIDHEQDIMQRLGNLRKDKEVRLNQAYEFHQSDVKNGLKKTVTIQLWGCEKWVMDYIPKSKDMIVDLTKKGYIDIDRIFLITEVFYVTEVKLYISVGDVEDFLHLQGQIPIGFSMERYKLDKDGILGSHKHVKLSTWFGKWSRETQTSLGESVHDKELNQTPWS